MAAKKLVNLLPSDLAAGGSAGKALVWAKSLAVSLSAGLLVLMSLGFGTLYYYNNRLSGLAEAETQLKQSIRSLEQTESGMVLTRERLKMVDKILATRTIEDRFDKQNELLALSREGIRFREIGLDQSDSSLVLESTSSRALSDLFDNFFVNDSFDELVLNSLVFNPFVGYRVDLGVY